MGNFKFYTRTIKEYLSFIFKGNFSGVSSTPGTLEFDADFYSFTRNGYYVNRFGQISNQFP
jgi:hypothetical protein